MRQLSATLLAAQQEHLTEPVVEVVIDDRHAGVFRPRWQPFVSDSAPDGQTVIVPAYDGAFLRIRSDPDTAHLYVQRVSDHGSAAEWTNWTLLESAISPAAQIAFAYDGLSIQAIFFVAADQRTIKMRQTADSGQTWSAAASVVTVASGRIVRSVAGSLNAGSGTLYCFYSDESSGSESVATGQIFTTTRAESGGAWSAPQAWGRGGVAATSGIAVTGAGDAFKIAACIDGCLYTFLVPAGSLDSWPAPLEVMRSDSPDVSYAWPSIALVFGAHYYIFFVENNARGAYSRLQHVITPRSWDAAMLPRPYQMAAAFGACALADVGYQYLCTSRYVYRARRWDTEAGDRVSCGADVHSLQLSERLERPGRLWLVLRNDDGRYCAAGHDGPLAPIRPGSQVSVRLGYYTAGGHEVSYYRSYWIIALHYHRRAGSSRLALEATDGWGLLDRMPARQSYAWGVNGGSSHTAGGILSAVLTGFGFYVSTDGSSAWDRPLSRFAINPGTSWGDAVRRLLRLAGGCLIFATDAEWEDSWPSAVAHLSCGDASSTYAYGGDHPIIAADHGLTEHIFTHVVALGEQQVYGEALDWSEIELANEDRVGLVVDRRLATQGEAAARAADELAAWQRAAAGSSLTVAPNVAQEVLDVVSVTDPAAGLDNALRRVVGIEVMLDRDRRLFEQRLELGAG